MKKMDVDTEREVTGKQHRSQMVFTEWGDVELHRQVFEGENRLEVIAGTNVPQGGASAHGGRTVLMIHDARGTAVEAATVMTQGENERPCGIVFVVGGDSEARTLADALEFAAATIKRQIKDNHGGQG